MTATLIALFSIVIGITGAIVGGYWFPKYSFGFTGNTIAGVFGSIFLIKSIGRMGFDPQHIIQNGTIHYKLFIINMFVSFVGGILALILIHKLKIKLNSTTESNVKN